MHSKLYISDDKIFFFPQLVKSALNLVKLIKHHRNLKELARCQHSKVAKIEDLSRNVKINWASMRENSTLLQSNNKGTDQSAHVFRLISAFAIHSLENIIHSLTCYMQIFNFLARLCS